MNIQKILKVICSYCSTAVYTNADVPTYAASKFDIKKILNRQPLMHRLHMHYGMHYEMHYST